MKTLLNICGIYNLGFVIFHIFFWKIFKWREELPRLGFVNRGIMQVLNLSLTFVFLIFAVLCFTFSENLLTTTLGRFILAGISVFWILRAIEQIIFFGVKNVVSVLFLLVFVIGAVIHLIPLI